MVYYRLKCQDTYPYILTLVYDHKRYSQAFMILVGQGLEQSTLLGVVNVCFKAFLLFQSVVYFMLLYVLHTLSILRDRIGQCL